MVVKRRISKQKYLLAAVFTFLIFSLGITLGVILDNERFRYVDQLNKIYELDYKRIQFQSLYLNTIRNDNHSCMALFGTLEDAIADLGYSLERFLEYEKQSKIKRDEFTVIKRRYLLDNLKYWLFSREAKQMCNLDVVTILYFYSESECDDCPNQGVILTYFKKKFGDKLLIFPIDVDLEEDEKIITLLRKNYEAFSYPTIVIEDTKYSGVQSKEVLSKIICDGFKNPQPECLSTLADGE